MKRLFLLLVLCTTALYAQQDAWVYFSDKPNADYYLAYPLEMLSQKALDRRAAHNVTLDDKDVPIHPDYLNNVAASSGITVMAKSKWLNAVHVRGEFADINALRDFSFVSSIEFADKTLNNRRGSGV
ncbi:MAG: peptidase S8, partial [Flavobacterium sp.]